VHILKGAPALEQARARARGALYAHFSSFSSFSSFSPRPWGGLALALLLGVKDSLGEALGRAYRDAGCSYMLALSGMHLAVIAGAFSRALKPVLGLKPAACAGLVLVLAYVYLAGNLPSLNRAALMYVLGTAAALGMIPKQPLTLLALSFLLQLCLQRDAGRSVSFMLSYLALLGILTMGGALRRILEGAAPRFIAAPLSASIGAFAAAAPAVTLFFETLHPFGIITGLAAAPLTSLFMIISLASLLIDPLVPVPACALALSVLYAILTWLVEQGARFPALPLPFPLTCAAALLTALLCRRLETARRKIDPFDYTL
jgi:competence protein ComEC